jgi:hypothetical protein
MNAPGLGTNRPTRTGSPANGTEIAAPPSRRKAVPFLKALDAHDQPIRGLWKRNDSDYARLTVPPQIRLLTTAGGPVHGTLPGWLRGGRFIASESEAIASVSTVEDAMRG